MKGFIFLLFFCFVSKQSLGAIPFFQTTARLSVNFLGAPVYTADHKLSIQFHRNNSLPSEIKYAKLSIEYRGNAGATLFKQESRVSDDLLNCLNDLTQDNCAPAPTYLPMALERNICSVEIMLTGPGGALANGALLSRPDCVTTVPVGLKAADLAWNELIAWNNLPGSASPYPFENKKQLRAYLRNVGDRKTVKNYQAFAIGETSGGEIIWTSVVEGLGEILPQGEIELLFPEFISPWQWHQLCRVRLIGDPKQKVPEKNKMNNEQTFDFGLCEDAPDSSERADVAPWMEVTDGILALHIANLSKSNLAGPVTFIIEARTATGALTDSFEMSYGKPIEGYGMYGTYEWRPPRVDSCHFKVMLDPMGYLGERVRENNIYELNICQ
ncbi:MAG: hypothetical protein HYV97_00470 [Bdellovibrio sp.]|nr:hypothetical protein [Bdellovibrio sp.]